VRKQCLTISAVLILCLSLLLTACGGGGGGSAAPSGTKAITAFSITSPAVTGTIDENAKTITVTVPFGTAVTALIAAFTSTGESVKVGNIVQVSGTTPNDFTNPVAYIVTAADGTTATYTVTVSPAPISAKAITAFSIASPAATGVINESAKTIAVTVPFGTNLNPLVATFTTTGASVKVGSTVQISGTTPNNFTGPVAYVVTAADNTTATYTVTVTAAPNSSAKTIDTFSFTNPSATGIINEGAKTIAVTVPFATNLTALVATFTTTGASVNVGSTVQISGTTPNNFTSPVAYVVTDANGATATYAVTVTTAPNPSAKTIDTFSFTSPAATGTINQSTKSIAVTVPFETDVTALVATFTKTGSTVKVGATVQISGTTPNNFTNPVAYVVTAADNSTATYTVTVTKASSFAKAITAFSFSTPLTTVAIDEVAKTISVTMPSWWTNLNSLVATFTTTGASVKVGTTVQISGTTPNDFTNPVAYVVTAADSSSVTYIVTVTARILSVTHLAGPLVGGGSADGLAAAATFGGPSGITKVGTDIYVADANNHTIRKIDSLGAVTTIAGLAGNPGSMDGTGTAARFNIPRGITSDGTNLYVADTGNHTIRKIDISVVPANVSTIAGSAGNSGFADGTTTARFNSPFGITSDGAGTNLYVADTNNHTIRKIDISVVPANVSTIAGSAGNSGFADGTTTARFNDPQGITSDGTGTNLYVADTGNQTIRKIDISVVPANVSTIAGSAGHSGFADGTTTARFNYPFGITSDGTGTNLYVTDTGNDTIRKIDISVVPANVSTIAGLAGNPGSIDAAGTAARFNQSFGITSDGTNLYVADTGNNTIRQIAGGVVTTIAGPAVNSSSTGGASGFADGTGAAARFVYPSGVASDGTNLYVADTGNHTIRRIDSLGVVTTLAGLAGNSGSTDGTGATARFNSPYGITIDGTGTNLYVADTNNHTIRQIVIATGVVTTFAGTGSVGFTNGTGTAASFYSPSGITIDGTGTNLYVADTYNHAIRQVVISTKAVTTFAGTGISGSGDATGTAASFNQPSGITFDGANLYVADTNNSTIRKIVLSTKAVSTLAGLAGNTGSADATGTAASFNHPRGVTSDGTNLYVVDTYNSTIRKIVIATGAVTTLAGLAGNPGSADATGTGSDARFYNPVGITFHGTNFYVADTNNHAIRQISM